jgi:hypothetical protein
MIGRRVHADLLPMILLGRSSQRAYAKPFGYAGDFETISLIYQNQPTGVGCLGALIGDELAEAPRIVKPNDLANLGGESTAPSEIGSLRLFWGRLQPEACQAAIPPAKQKIQRFAPTKRNSSNVWSTPASHGKSGGVEAEQTGRRRIVIGLGTDGQPEKS